MNSFPFLKVRIMNFFSLTCTIRDPTCFYNKSLSLNSLNCVMKSLDYEKGIVIYIYQYT